MVFQRLIEQKLLFKPALWEYIFIYSTYYFFERIFLKKIAYRKEHVMPEVSIIIPIYNQENFISQCIESVRTQTFSDIEILCIDDGSEDATPVILEAFAQQDRRVKIYRQENLGAAAARNTGIQMATGTFIYFVDADDFIEPQLVEQCLERIEETEADMIIFGYRNFDNRTGVSCSVNQESRKSYSPRLVFTYKDNPDYLFYAFENYVWNKFFKASFITEHDLRFEAINLTEDLMFTCPALIKAQKISYIDTELIFHRIGLDTNLMSHKDAYPEDFIQAFIALKSFLQEEGVYEDLITAYRYWALGGTQYNLISMRTPEGCEKFFSLLREWGFAEMDLLNIPPSYFQETPLFDSTVLPAFYYEVINNDYERLLFDHMREYYTVVEILHSVSAERKETIAGYETEINTQRRRIVELEKQVSDAHAHIVDLTSQYDNLNLEYTAQMNAAEQKVGRIICWIPRFIQRMILKGRSKQ
jgi:glycosyltransferase involved in cell wall biosynthesis